MPLDLNTALNSYGFVGQLANAIPELKAILDQAISQEWVPEQFTRTLMDSGWWKSNAESVRQLTRLQTTDPATYQQNVANATSKVRLMSRGMGRTVDEQGLALQALLGNWDDEQIKSAIGFGQLTTNEGGALSADAGQLQGHMTKLAQDYGVAYTPQFLNTWTDRIQVGGDTLDGFEALMKSRAKATYPHLSGQIDAGMTVRDVADPYIATYAQTLEVPETGITLSDQAIQKALQAKGPDGTTFTSKPMYEFQRELKNDPRWDKTNNAKTEAYGMVNQLGKDFGFLS